MIRPNLPVRSLGQPAHTTVVQGNTQQENVKVILSQKDSDISVFEDQDKPAAGEDEKTVGAGGETERLPLKEISNNRLESESPQQRKK